MELTGDHPRVPTNPPPPSHTRPSRCRRAPHRPGGPILSWAGPGPGPGGAARGAGSARRSCAARGRGAGRRRRGARESSLYGAAMRRGAALTRGRNALGRVFSRPRAASAGIHSAILSAGMRCIPAGAGRHSAIHSAGTYSAMRKGMRSRGAGIHSAAASGRDAGRRPAVSGIASDAPVRSRQGPPISESYPSPVCLESLPMHQSDLVRDHTWVGEAAPRRLRAGARTAGPGRRCRRRPGALRATAPVLRRDRSRAHESCSAAGTGHRHRNRAWRNRLSRCGSRHG